MPNTPGICAGCARPQPMTGSYFVSAYPPFDLWTSRHLDTYRDVLRSEADARTPLGLYLHLPFCEKRCDYCYYLAYDDRGEEIDRYLEAVDRELALYGEAPYLKGRPIDYAYVGGGTPSLLSAIRLERLLSTLARHLDLGVAREVTFECAPRSVTAEKLRLLARAGVTRISLGVQQLDDRVLSDNGRVHLVDDVLRAYESIRTIGFEVVNLDLMVGLRGETEESFFHSLELTLEIEPESVTIYQLEIPHNTPLFRSLGDGVAGDLPDWEVKRDRLTRAFDRLEVAGYVRRSAYTAVRDPKRHAFLYQDLQYGGADLLGLGASSFSYLAGVHQQNRASLEGYLESLDQGVLPLGRAYPLDADQRLVRQMVLQLKLGRVDLLALGRELGVDARHRFGSAIEILEHEGNLIANGDAVEVTTSGLARIDHLLPHFYDRRW